MVTAVDIVFRRYGDDDKLAVETFRCTTPGERWTKPPQRVIRCAPQEIRDGADARLVVAEEQAGRIVGVVVFGPNEHRWYIHAIGVVRDRRRQGIGERLKITALAEIAAVAGGRQNVFSEVHKNNLAMLGLNDKLNVLRAPDPENRAHFISAIAVTPAGP